MGDVVEALDLIEVRGELAGRAPVARDDDFVVRVVLFGVEVTNEFVLTAGVLDVLASAMRQSS